MALAQATLASELEVLEPTITAGVAETRLAEAYGAYMHAADSNDVAIVTASVDSIAVPAMASAMTFVAGSSSADGAAVVVAGVTAFWGAMVGSPVAFFAGATAITPPPFAALAAALVTVFDAATEGSATLSAAAASMAAAIHTATGGQGGQGTATFPGPLVALIA